MPELGFSLEGLNVLKKHEPAVRELGLNVETIFNHPLIRPWRQLPGERDNSVLETTLKDGRSIRWHVKRYEATPPHHESPVMREISGYGLLIKSGIPTLELVAWGEHPDHRSAIISDDLTGYEAADKLIAGGMPFDAMLESTADLAAKLHRASLHHRDLYLCHFFVNRDDPRDVKLIDVARVASFERSMFKRRWIVKDLAQFWYSTTSLPISDAQRSAWLERYASQRQLAAASLRSSIIRKSNWIARHDARLKRAQPNRNVSLST